LVLFKDIEANGGFLKQLNEGNNQKNPGKCRQRTGAFDSGKEILWELIQNKDDRMKQDLELFPL
jgi:methylmalonyl-CoA mutase